MIKELFLNANTGELSLFNSLINERAVRIFPVIWEFTEKRGIETDRLLQEGITKIDPAMGIFGSAIGIAFGLAARESVKDLIAVEIIEALGWTATTVMGGDALGDAFAVSMAASATTFLISKFFPSKREL